MPTANTREYLIRLFTFEKPHALSYQYRKKSGTYKNDLPILKQMIKDGLIKQVLKNTKFIEYQWIGPIPYVDTIKK